uniref:Uncharacterized protein n=1 Tax=Triticum urartu TaxID=4572 RepID=A0A8R7RFJ7_TRIUA
MPAVVPFMTSLLARPSTSLDRRAPVFPPGAGHSIALPTEAPPPPPLCVCGITQPLIIWPVPQVGHQMLRTCHIMLGYGGNDTISWATSHGPRQLQIRGRTDGVGKVRDRETAAFGITRPRCRHGSQTRDACGNASSLPDNSQSFPDNDACGLPRRPMQPSRLQRVRSLRPGYLAPSHVSLAAARRRLPAQMGGRRLELAPAQLQVSRGRGRPAYTGDGAECWPRSPRP